MIEPAFKSRAEIEAHQLAALRKVLGVVRGKNTFWDGRLRKTDFASVAEFTRSTPLLTKADISSDQISNPPYGTNLTYSLARYTRLHQTSSTTGTPIRWLDTPEDWAWLLDGWQIVFEAAGVTGEDRIFVASSFGPFIGFWMAWDAALRMGCLAIPGGGMNTNTRLRAILANEVSVLCCTPTYAIHLGESARRDGLDLLQSNVRRIIVAGEPGGSVPAVRQRIERLWPGAQVIDHHGMTETGPVTFECPNRPGVLHIVESAFLCEFIDPRSTEPINPGDGAMSELVITTLGRQGSPVFRYRTGDLVRPESVGPCACGRSTMRLVGGILSRIDDMVIVRGTNVYPGAVASVLARFDEVAEYEVHVKTEGPMTDIEIVIEPHVDSDVQELPARVARALRDAFNLRFDVRLAEAGSLPRYEFKERRWKR